MSDLKDRQDRLEEVFVDELLRRFDEDPTALTANELAVARAYLKDLRGKLEDRNTIVRNIRPVNNIGESMPFEDGTSPLRAWRASS